MIIYISLPITGRDPRESRESAESARAGLRALYPDAEIVTPFELADRVDSLNPSAGYADYMKEDIAFIIEHADTVCFLVNPRTTPSNGVKLEWQTAKIYHKKIITFGWPRVHTVHIR